LRLDETLRGEIKSWKDQFLRVDAEHTRLLNQQLSSATSSQVRPQLPPPPPPSSNTYPPHPRMIPGMNPQTQATLIAHTPKHVPFPAAGSSATSSATKRGVSASSSNKDKVPAPPSSPTKAPAFPRIVRRVQAVIEVPVKEEEEEEGGCIEDDDDDDDDDDRPFDPDDGVARPRSQPGSAILYPTSTPTRTGTGGAGAGGVEGGGGGGRGGARRRRKSSASSHQRRSLVMPPSDDGNYGYVDDGEEPQSDASDGGEYVDEEEVGNAMAKGGGGGSGTPATMGRRTVPWGRKHIHHEPDEEDDELMMYAKVQFFSLALSVPLPPSFVLGFVDAVRFVG